MISRLFGNKLKSVQISRDAVIIVGVSIGLSLIALVAFAATLSS